jgi:hypothetical protein
MSPIKPWKEALKIHCKAGKSKKGEYFRFDIEFKEKEPSLDDTSKMRELSAYARAAIYKSIELDRLAQCMIAELFFFELDSVPRKENGMYSCTSYILYRLRSKTAAFEALLGQLTKTLAKFFLGNRPLLGSIEDRSSIERDGNFRKRVYFQVSNRQSSMSIYLKEGSLELCNISGSPFSIDWLVAT